jgi:hypothetical protein
MGSTRRGFRTLTKLPPRYTPEAARLSNIYHPNSNGLYEPLKLLLAQTG